MVPHHMKNCFDIQKIPILYNIAFTDHPIYICQIFMCSLFACLINQVFIMKNEEITIVSFRFCKCGKLKSGIGVFPHWIKARATTDPVAKIIIGQHVPAAYVYYSMQLCWSCYYCVALLIINLLNLIWVILAERHQLTCKYDMNSAGTVYWCSVENSTICWK